MSGSTPILGLFLPGGGSQNKYGAADPVDIDKINDNFSRIDASLGVPDFPDASLPTNPFLWQVARATTTDNIVKWNGSNWINFLPNRLSPSSMALAYYTQDQLSNKGVLDKRYFTQSDLTTGGKLDAVYAKKGDGSSIHIAAIWSNTYTLNNGTRQHVTANFPSGRFTAAPQVVVTPNSTTPDNVSVSFSAPTKDSVEIYLSRTDAPGGQTTVSVIALQTN